MPRILWDAPKLFEELEERQMDQELLENTPQNQNLLGERVDAAPMRCHPKAVRPEGPPPSCVPKLGAPRGVLALGAPELEAAPTTAAVGFSPRFSHSAAGCDLRLSPKRCHVAPLPWAPAPTPETPMGCRREILKLLLYFNVLFLALKSKQMTEEKGKAVL